MLSFDSEGKLYAGGGLEEQVGVRRWRVYDGTLWAGGSMSRAGLGVSLAYAGESAYPPPKVLLSVACPST